MVLRNPPGQGEGYDVEDAVMSFERQVALWQVLLSAVMLSAVALIVQAKPKMQHAPTALEIARLPPFCAAKYRKDGGKEEKAMWQQRFGRENWVHMHHYCNALYYMNRARSETDKINKKYYLGVVVNNADYVLQRWSPQFQYTASARNLKIQADGMLRSLR